MKSDSMRIICFLICLAFLAQNCQSPKPETEAESGSGHTGSSKTSLDWQGTYTGVLPCADCEGIETILILNRNLKYTLSTRYIGKDEQALQHTGAFTWNEAGSTILLGGIDDGPSQYLVGEHMLIQLDRNGKEITGNLSKQYVLMKTIESRLASVRWTLVELMGKYLEHSAAHIRFDADINQINGYGWCNTFTGNYKFLQGNQITFTEMIPTSKICPDTTIEKQFLNMFRAVDTYILDNKVLTLSRGSAAPLAKFEAVKSVRQ